MADKNLSPSKRARLSGGIGRAVPSSSSYPTEGVGRRECTAPNFVPAILKREDLKRKKELEIEARVAEKLAEVRKRENAKIDEREKRDATRLGAEKKILLWTCNHTHRGDLIALLSSLDKVLYTGHTWRPVSKDALKTQAQLKLNYRKATLQVHPDKIGSKNLRPDQQMLAELIFTELQNAYEVFQAVTEGIPPPAGSVGPKNTGVRGEGTADTSTGTSMNNKRSYTQTNETPRYGERPPTPQTSSGMGHSDAHAHIPRPPPNQRAYGTDQTEGFRDREGWTPPDPRTYGMHQTTGYTDISGRPAHERRPPSPPRDYGISRGESYNFSFSFRNLERGRPPRNPGDIEMRRQGVHLSRGWDYGIDPMGRARGVGLTRGFESRPPPRGSVFRGNDRGPPPSYRRGGLRATPLESIYRENARGPPPSYARGGLRSTPLERIYREYARGPPPSYTRGGLRPTPPESIQRNVRGPPTPYTRGGLRPTPPESIQRNVRGPPPPYTRGRLRSTLEMIYRGNDRGPLRGPYGRGGGRYTRRERIYRGRGNSRGRGGRGGLMSAQLEERARLKAMEERMRLEREDSGRRNYGVNRMRGGSDVSRGRGRGRGRRSRA